MAQGGKGADAIIIGIPALAAYLGGLGKPKMLFFHQLKGIPLPVEGGCLAAGIMAIHPDMVVFLVQRLQLGLPAIGSLLQTENVGIIVLDDLKNAGCTLLDGVAVGIVAGTDIKRHDFQIIDYTSNSK